MDRILIILLYILLFLVMYIDINKKYIPNVLNLAILVLSIFICGIDKVDIFFIGASCYTLQIYIFYLLVFSLATLYIIIYIVISYCRNKPVKIRGVELAFAPYICLAFIIIYNFNLIERIIEKF